MVPTPSFPMPFETVPCSIWLARDGGTDAYNNQVVEYADEPDWTGRCVYTPGRTRYDDTDDDFEQGRPHGDESELTVYLPKSLALDVRNGRIAVYPPDDQVLSGRVFDIVGQPYSFPRAAVPGDFSWAIEAGERLG